MAKKDFQPPVTRIWSCYFKFLPVFKRAKISQKATTLWFHFIWLVSSGLLHSKRSSSWCGVLILVHVCFVRIKLVFQLQGIAI